MSALLPDVVCEFVANVRPEPKRRPRFGNGRTYTDERTVAYESHVALIARKAMGRRQPSNRPVKVTIHTHQTDARTCDIDNAAKAVLDALNGIAFEDDRQVSDLHIVRHVRSDGDRVGVRIEETP